MQYVCFDYAIWNSTAILVNHDFSMELRLESI